MMNSNGKFRPAPGDLARAIVTGGAGFIGSTLVKRLVRLGVHVAVIDNLWRGDLDNLRLEDGTYAIDIDRDFHCADLADFGKCLGLIRGADLVYHLADVVGGVHFAFKEQMFIFRQNLLINTNVLSASIANGIPGYIYVGTACSYPRHLQMTDQVAALREEQVYPAEPESSYGWSKLMGEYEAELARQSGKISVGVLRLHNVYGPGASCDPERSQAIPSLMRKAALYPAEPFLVWGSGNQYRDFVYVDDVVDALLLAAERGMNQPAIQVGTGRPVSLREIANLIVDISGKPIVPAFDIRKPEGDRGRVAVCDRALDILGWRPKVDLRTGLERTYCWVRARVCSEAREVASRACPA